MAKRLTAKNIKRFTEQAILHNLTTEELAIVTEKFLNQFTPPKAKVVQARRGIGSY